MPDWITSPNNDRVKTWKKLLTAKGRKKAQAYLLEGWHLVQEAAKAGVIQEAWMTQTYYDHYADHLQGLPITLISDDIAKALSPTQAPQAIFAKVPLTYASAPLQAGKYILLDSLQDPGNVGTIIRTADAAGFSGVIVGDQTVDVFNDKTVRSMQGSQFHIPIYKMPLTQAIAQLKALEIPVYATELNPQAISLFQVEVGPTVAVVMGNEGNGVSQDILSACDRSVYIPILGQAESLNVAAASAVVLYHFLEKR